MNKVAILVLAAGKSSRMKSIKQLEKVNEKTLLDITLEKAKQLKTKNIYCVLGANADKIQKEITSKNTNFIINKNFEKGLSSSIVSGLYHFKKNNLNFDGVFILLADQPAIETSYLQDIINLFHKNGTKIIASNYDGFFGVPALFPATYFSSLLEINGDKGAKEFLEKNQKNIVTPTLKTNLIDIDTKQDLDIFKSLK